MFQRLLLRFLYIFSGFAFIILIAVILFLFNTSKFQLERKEFEEALKKSEEKYRGILESMEEGYYEVDLAGNFTFVNEAMSKIRGQSRAELIGTNNRDYMSEETAREVV